MLGLIDVMGRRFFAEVRALLYGMSVSTRHIKMCTAFSGRVFFWSGQYGYGLFVDFAPVPLCAEEKRDIGLGVLKYAQGSLSSLSSRSKSKSC